MACTPTSKFNITLITFHSEVREELKLVGAVGTFCASGGRHGDLLDGFDLGD